MALLSLLVLVLVMVASLTRVETSITGNTRKFSQARQNALLALDRAMSRLQLEAGPDERVTATADLVYDVGSTNDHKEKWTGVWDTQNPSDPPAWLVSGTIGNFSDQVAAPSVELVGANTASSAVHVWVPLEEIRGEAPDGTADVLLGRFGYWVGDEGVKARVNLVDHRTLSDPEDAYYAASADSQGGRMRHQAPQRIGTEHVNGFEAVLPNDLKLEKVLALEQAGFVGATTAGRKLRFHDVTTTSRGLLVDVAGGGLKWDLTTFLRGEASTDWLLTAGSARREIAPALSAAGAVSPTFGYLRAWWATGAGLSTFGGVLAPRPYEPPPAGGGDGTPGVHPILVRAGIRVGVHRTTPGTFTGGQQNHRIRPYIVPIFVLWNPFDVDLAATDYRIRVLARSGAEITYTITQGSQVKTLPAWPLPAEMDFDLAASDPNGSGDVTLRAGEAVVLSIADDLATSASNPGYWKGFVPGGSVPLATRWRKHNGVFFDLSDAYDYVRDEAGIEDEATAAISPANGLFEAFELQMKEGSNWVSLQTVTDLPDMVQIGGIPSRPLDDENPSVDAPWYRPVDNSGQVTVFNPDLVAQVWTFKTADLDPAVDDEVRIFADYDILAPVLDGSLTGGVNPLWRAFKAGEVKNGGGDDLFYAPTTSAESSHDVAHFGASLADTASTVNILFEVPRAGSGPADETELYSIGRFAHVRLSDRLYEPPYAIGSSFEPVAGSPADYAYELNAVLWDQYFLSGIPADLTQADIDDPLYFLPFGRLRFVPRLGELPLLGDFSANWVTRPAAHLWVEGMFNVNSTSVQAWRAVLSSYAGVPVANRVGAGEGNADHPFARFAFPDTAGYVSGDGKTDPTAWAGYRRLTTTEVDALATEIVSELQARGTPFLSLGEFVNREPGSSDSARRGMGLLQRAIENSGINNDFDDAVNSRFGTIPGYQATNAPGYLTQADLLMALGGVLSVRSDTFLIRAYGETLNPVSQIREGQAWCEAIVQRVPDYIEPSPAQQPWDTPVGVNATYGRRFKIVGFRWLTPADI